MTWWNRHPAIAYTAARLLLFAVPFGLLLLFVPVVWAVLIAFVFSAIVSVFVLSRMRDAWSASLAGRADRTRARMAERAAAEDAWDEEQRTHEPGSDDDRI
jgi:uncharacterized membrane protein